MRKTLTQANHAYEHYALLEDHEIMGRTQPRHSGMTRILLLCIITGVVLFACQFYLIDWKNNGFSLSAAQTVAPYKLSGSKAPLPTTDKPVLPSSDKSLGQEVAPTLPADSATSNNTVTITATVLPMVIITVNQHGSPLLILTNSYSRASNEVNFRYVDMDDRPIPYDQLNHAAIKNALLETSEGIGIIWEVPSTSTD